MMQKEPFGVLWGEGSEAIVLKKVNEAIEQGDHIYAVIKGSAINQDGNSIGITAPNMLAQIDVLKKSWESAGIDPEWKSKSECITCSKSRRI